MRHYEVKRVTIEDKDLVEFIEVYKLTKKV